VNYGNDYHSTNQRRHDATPIRNYRGGGGPGY
jgi:hypothetical protein